MLPYLWRCNVAIRRASYGYRCCDSQVRHVLSAHNDVEGESAPNEQTHERHYVVGPRGFAQPAIFAAAVLHRAVVQLCVVRRKAGPGGESGTSCALLRVAPYYESGGAPGVGQRANVRRYEGLTLIKIRSR